MKYNTVFEISSISLGNLSFLLLGILFIIVASLMIKFRNQITQKAPKLFVNVFIITFFCFSIFWTIIASAIIGYQEYAFRSKYSEGDFLVTEGIIKNFDPMPKGGHQLESFTVNNIKFSYSDFVLTPGFNNTASHGGPIKEGLPVRISYRDNTILKLEIAINEK